MSRCVYRLLWRGPGLGEGFWRDLRAGEIGWDGMDQRGHLGVWVSRGAVDQKEREREDGIGIGKEEQRRRSRIQKILM
jgi:hypothetical protein